MGRGASHNQSTLADSRIASHPVFWKGELQLEAKLTNSWRHEGDELCDSVVRELRLGPGQDGLQAILDHIERPVAEQAACVQAFWAQVSHLRNSLS
jgi:hypothetical protein